MDRRFSPERIATVLREIDADVIALQELRSHSNGVDLLGFLRDETGFHALADWTMKLADGEFGNGLLSRFPIASSSVLDLSWPGREPRHAIDATIDVDGIALRIVATHLGLRPGERRRQVEQLIETIRREPDRHTVLLGDINEWFVRTATLRQLHAHFGETAAPATFPSIHPLFALDRLWCHPAAALKRLEAHRSPGARRASDHLPLVARLVISPTR